MTSRHHNGKKHYITIVLLRTEPQVHLDRRLDQNEKWQKSLQSFRQVKLEFEETALTSENCTCLSLTWFLHKKMSIIERRETQFGRKEII